MVSTLGLGMAANALAAILFGTNIYPVDSYVSSNPVVVHGVPIRPVYIVMPIVVLAVAIGVELLLRYTEFGIVTRAVIASNEGASLVGINVTRVVQISFVASAAMAALAGFLVAPVLSASPFVGESVMLFGFAAIAIGGFASFRGAIVGGLIVGLILSLTPAFMDPTWRAPFVWTAMVIILFIRPAGLFGKGGQFGAASARQV
jgi:branched-chain amino acid transport system permease protein